MWIPLSISARLARTSEGVAIRGGLRVGEQDHTIQKVIVAVPSSFETFLDGIKQLP